MQRRGGRVFQKPEVKSTTWWIACICYFEFRSHVTVETHKQMYQFQWREWTGLAEHFLLCWNGIAFTFQYRCPFIHMLLLNRTQKRFIFNGISLGILWDPFPLHYGLLFITQYFSRLAEHSNIYLNKIVWALFPIQVSFQIMYYLG